MPEGPEVYLQTEYLKNVVHGKKLNTITVIDKQKYSNKFIQVFKNNILKSQLEKLGYDILGPDLPDKTILDAFGMSRKRIAGFLMEQDKFCGIGNYIKAVVLYRARISPYCKANELSDSQKIRLWKISREVAQQAVDSGGGGNYGNGNNNFDITPYQMEFDSHGNKVISENIAGRMTWWVPDVQK